MNLVRTRDIINKHENDGAFKYIVLSVCLCGIHLNGFAQSTREAILEDIARTGGVYYAYPVKEAIATPPPKGYKPFYISHYARHGSRWIQSEQDYKTVVDISRKRIKPEL